MRRMKCISLVLLLVLVPIFSIPGLTIRAEDVDYGEEIILPFEYEVECYNYALKLVNSYLVTSFTIDDSAELTEGYISEAGAHEVVYYQDGEYIGEALIYIDYTDPVFSNVKDGATIPVGSNINFDDDLGVSLFTYYCEETDDYGYIEDITSWTPMHAGVYTLFLYDYAGNYSSITIIVDDSNENLRVKGLRNDGIYNGVVAEISVREGAIHYSINDGKTITTTNQSISIPFNKDGVYSLYVYDDFGKGMRYRFCVDKSFPVINMLTNNQYDVTPIKDKVIYMNQETHFTVKDPTLAHLHVDYYNGNTKKTTPLELNQSFTLSHVGKYEILAYDYFYRTTRLTVYLDYEQPSTNLIDGAVYQNYAIVKAEDDTKVTCFIDGVKKPLGTVIYEAGYHDITLTDQANNSVSLLIQIDKPSTDKTPPVVSGVTNKKTVKGVATVKFHDNSGIKSATLNGITVQSGVKVTKAGTYHLEVIDKVGNVKKLTFRVDLAAPKVKGVTPNKVYKGDVKISGVDDIEVRVFTINNNLSRGTVKVTKPGKHTVFLEDYAGRRTTTVFYIDKSTPKVSGVKNKAVYRKAVKVKFTDDTGIKTLTLNGKKFKNNSTIKKKGKYTLVAVDKAGRKTTVSFTIK